MARYRLSTYATWWISNRLQEAVRVQSNLVSLSSKTKADIKTMQSALAVLTKTLGREPEEQELLTELQWDATKLKGVQNAVALSKGTNSLDVGQDDDGDPQQSIEVETSGLEDNEEGRGAGNRKDNAEDLISQSLLEREIEGRLAQICPRTLPVFRMRYGLGGRERMTFSEISRALGITVEGIRQLELRAMACIRKDRRLKVAIADSLLDAGAGAETPVRSGYVRKS